ncbi:MAG TPA: hypothetical protein VFL04_04335, partial [Rectinemataceae bacterium]|nr:hypothetical protein [Rectinemataceae bacterium]
MRAAFPANAERWFSPWTRADVLVLVLLLGFSLLARLATLEPVPTGLEERGPWLAAKCLRLGLPLPELAPGGASLGLILPGYVGQLLFGLHPNVYYLAPVAGSLLLVVLVFSLCRRLRGRLGGFLGGLAAALLCVLGRGHPATAPLFPAIVAAILLLIMRYLMDEERRFPGLGFSALMLSLACEMDRGGFVLLAVCLVALPAYRARAPHVLGFGLVFLGSWLAEAAAIAAFGLGPAPSFPKPPAWSGGAILGPVLAAALVPALVALVLAAVGLGEKAAER